MDTGVGSARNVLFQELKPKCVELSQLVLRDDGSASNSKAVLQSATLLLAILEEKCKRTDGAFDEKLADYAFFPLSQILQRKKTYTDRLSEVTIKCMRILLEYGWRNSIALDLAKQLLILLTFVAGGVPGKESTPPPEELMIEAYGAFAALFRALANTPGGSASMVESGTIPALGHCVTVILDGITDGPSAVAQLQALQALDSVWHCIKDPEALSNFLPGTISALAKFLMPGTGSRRARQAIVRALDVLGHVLISILSDIRTRNIRNDKASNEVVDAGADRKQKNLTKSWLKATTGQIKLALSNVIRLRSHESVEVRKALNQVCITLLDECHDTLSEAAPILVETCMTLAGVDAEEELSLRATSLTDLASIHPILGDLIRNTVYNWVTSLPRVMQSNDESAKHAALGQLSKAHGLLIGLNLESSILEDALGSSLRDSITLILEASPVAKGVQEAEFDLNSQAAMTLVSDNAMSTHFHPIIMAQESQRQTRNQLATLISSLGSRQSQLSRASEMLEYARSASGPSLLSAYWLSSQILRSAESGNKDIDEFFEPSLTLSDEQESMNAELFSYSQSLLVSPDERTSDWRLQAIALEVMADTAQRMKEGFKTELVDTLYPIVQLLGSSNPRLREHAVTCLNIISKSCGYANASGLIVDNVDYMVNAISLRLNTFDISPQAPQVLVMMIRLTGPSLLLYLDDVVESIFAALDNFHGYQLLVDVLFTVLGEIVSVGSTSGQLQIEDTPLINHRKTRPDPTPVSELVKLLKPKTTSHGTSIPHEEVPQKPWKSAKTLLDEANPQDDAENSDQEGEGEDSSPLPQEVAKPPPTKTYTMLQSITRLSQHHLTSSSAHLRTKLLSLIRTSSSSLAFNEDAFLPLVNDIWPVLIMRLYDPEPYVQIAACETISEICRCAGDFLSTRFRDEFPAVLKLARSAKAKAESEKRGTGGRGMFSMASKVWEGLVGLLATVVEYVRVEDEVFDEVVDVLGALVWERKGVRMALEAVNEDAVWLVMQINGRNSRLETPIMEGFTFVGLDSAVSV
ncbi:armadillo-type protein [Rhexocercosporidium sp. MPI-PUGE-AT-0058]|nr:armadillo-type protein [Rhexocercosporidium sp. MPI-PUGE-AT-0058]